MRGAMQERQEEREKDVWCSDNAAVHATFDSTIDWLNHLDNSTGLGQLDGSDKSWIYQSFQSW